MITKPTDAPSTMFSLVRKAFTFEYGALVALSIAPSYTLKQFLELIMRGTDMRDIVIPIMVSAILLIVYIIVSAWDFYTGISASKKEHLESSGSARGFIKSDKLWSSIWKFFGVIMIATVLMIFTLLLVILDKDIMSGIFLYGIVFFYVVVIMFDLHSIGENHFRRFGTKPKIYSFIDEAAAVIRDGFIKKIGNLFKS